MEGNEGDDPRRRLGKNLNTQPRLYTARSRTIAPRPWFYHVQTLIMFIYSFIISLFSTFFESNKRKTQSDNSDDRRFRPPNSSSFPSMGTI